MGHGVGRQKHLVRQIQPALVKVSLSPVVGQFGFARIGRGGLGDTMRTDPVWNLYGLWKKHPAGKVEIRKSNAAPKVQQAVDKAHKPEKPSSKRLR